MYFDKAEKMSLLGIQYNKKTMPQASLKSKKTREAQRD